MNWWSVEKEAIRIKWQVKDEKVFTARAASVKEQEEAWLYSANGETEEGRELCELEKTRGFGKWEQEEASSWIR